MRDPNAAPAIGQPPAELRYVEGQVIQVHVVGVLIGRQSEVGDSEIVDDTIPPELQDDLGWDSSFSYNGKDFATAHGYDSETRMLSLKLKRRMTLPVEGEILCEDIPTKIALDRQDAAISSFLDDLAVNPRLGPLLLHPEQNTIDERSPVELIQPLKPTDAMTDLIGRVLAARDFFLIQGPPETARRR